MVRDGVSYPDIASELDITVEEAMQLYRDHAWDHWDTGWEMTASDGGTGRFVSGVVEAWTDADDDVQVTIEEIHDSTVPLSLELADGESMMNSHASLSPDQCRELAKVLEECAEIAEGQK